MRVSSRLALHVTPAVCLLAALTGAAWADPNSMAHAEEFTIPIPEWRLSAAPASRPAARLGGSAGDSDPKPFGHAGSEYWTLGFGVAHNFDSAWDYSLHGAYSRFLVNDVEFAAELYGWYFSNDDGAVGVNPSLALRWHLYHSPERDWSVFVDAGMGVLLASREVPRGGTNLDFTPRVGAGFTHQISDDGKRLQVAVRWHHISNARIAGDGRNPSRDGVMLYAGLMIPF